jgi:hypothetical protein
MVANRSFARGSAPSSGRPGATRVTRDTTLFVGLEDPRRLVFIEHWASPDAQELHHTHPAQVRRFQEDGMDAVERFELLAKLNRVVRADPRARHPLNLIDLGAPCERRIS